MTLTVVIPTLNEVENIGPRLRELAEMRVDEVIVVDGGSTDGTLERVRQSPAARLVQAERGRGTQLNAGAALATSEVLLFLHADVRLPPDAPTHVMRTLDEPGVVAGAFRTWTLPEPGRRPLGPLLHLADLRSRYSSLPYGDQALFLRRAVLQQVGGVPELPLLEDLTLSRRLAQLGTIRTCQARVKVSGRRFQARPFFYAAYMTVTPALARVGVPIPTLARLYGNVR
jgi:rSAM/selenodomain-associated transferase 2